MPVNPLDPNLEKMPTVKGMKDPNAVTKVDPYGKAVSDGKIATGAAGTPEGAYNPRTSGYEAANANVGVNTGAYSVANKAKMAQAAGYSDLSKVSQDAFFRNADGSMGFKMPKITPAKPTGVAPTGPTSMPTGSPATLDLKNPLSPTQPAAGSTPPAAPAAGGLPAPTNAPVTGIPEVDAANAKAAKDRDEKVKATENAYVLGKSNFEKNAGYYQNFDAVNKSFTGVMDERRAALAASPNGDLTDAQAQAIATKYGVSVDAVRDPNKVWDSLTMTEEGKKKLGVTDWETGMGNLKTDYDRKKADIQTRLDNTKTQYDQQIDDVARQLERNVNFMTASGAWSGASKSSGYLTGIQNVKEDGQRTIERIEALKDQMEAASGEDAARLTEDYGKAVSAAKKKFDDELSTMRIDAGTQLSGIAEQYGVGSDKLKTALQSIEDAFHTKTVESTAAYLKGMREISGITNDNIEMAMKQSKFREDQENKAYEDYTKDNGAALAGTTYSSLMSQVKAGKISATRADMLKSVMVNSIVNTLQKNGSAVNSAEQSTIDTLLKHGSTPSQVVAQMRNMDKFAMSDKPDVQKIGDKSYVFNPNTSSYEELKDTPDTIDPSSVTIAEGNRVTFTPEAAKKLQMAGINISLLALADGTVRTGRKNAEQCGGFVNDVVGIPGLMGDLLADKPVNSQVPAIGSAIVMDFKDANGNSYNKNGHVGIVVGIDGSRLKIKSSNAHIDPDTGKGDGKITTDILDLADPKNVEVKGFYEKAGVGGNAGKESDIDSVSKQIAEYRLDPSKLNVYRKTPEVWAKILEKAQELNPTFSDSDYAKNSAAVKSYGPAGKIGLSLKSLDTVMGHLGSYLDAVNKYNSNKPVIGKILNMVENPTGGLLGGTALSTLNPIAHNIGDETAKFFGGGTSSAGDREKRADEVDVNATPSQAKEFVKTQIDQLASQTKAWNDQYKAAVGHYNKDIMTNEAKKKVRDLSEKYGLGINISDITGNPEDDAADSAAPSSSSLDLYNSY